MKKLLLMAAMILLLVPVTYGQADYSNSYTHPHLLDTTKDVDHDTVLTFRFNDLGDMTSGITGWIHAYYTAIDTGTAAAEIIDTEKDTLFATIIGYTYGNSNAYRTLYSITEADFHEVTTTTADYNWFHIPLDSLIGDEVQIQLIFAVQDSDYSVAREAASLDYKVSIKMWAR